MLLFITASLHCYRYSVNELSIEAKVSFYLFTFENGKTVARNVIIDTKRDYVYEISTSSEDTV